MYRTILLLIFMSPFILFAQQTLTKFQDNGKVGYKDSQGKIQIQAQFNYGSDFLDGTAIIVLDGKRGLINELGAYIIKPKFEDLGLFFEGVAPARLDGKYGFIDTEGNWKMTAQFEEAYGFSEGFSRVKSGKYYGFVNSDLELVISPIYNHASDFKRGKAAVQVEAEASYSYIKYNGELAFEGMYEMAYAFHTETAKVRLCGKWYEIDEEGIIIGEIEKRHEEY